MMQSGSYREQRRCYQKAKNRVSYRYQGWSAELFASNSQNG